jgi:N-methylhydantoinase B
VRSDKRSHPPHGLFGGAEGAPSTNHIETGNEQITLPTLPTKPINLRQGAVFRHMMAGGGGYGDAYQREPERVLEDNLDGRVSVQAARDAYGVALTSDVDAIDPDATARLRAARAIVS